MSASARLDIAINSLSSLCEGNSATAVVLDITVAALRGGDLDGAMNGIRTFSAVVERCGLKLPLITAQLLDMHMLAQIASLESAHAVL